MTTQTFHYKHGGFSAIHGNNMTLNSTRWGTSGPTLVPYSMTHLFATLVILGTIILLAMVGNVFVMAAVVLERNLRTVANYLVVSLAVADMMVATLVMPMAAVNEVSQRWFLGREVCDMWVSLDVICCTSSILHLVAISLDRYWAVTRIDYIHNRSGRLILAMIGASWGLALVISIPPLFTKRDRAGASSEDDCLISQDLGYTVFSTVGAFYLPFIAMMIIYFRIFLAARDRIRKKRFHAQVKRERSLAVGRHGGPATTTVTADGASTRSHSPTEGLSMTTVTMTVNVTTESSDNSVNGSPALLSNDTNRNETKCLRYTTSPTVSQRSSPPHPAAGAAAAAGRFELHAATDSAGVVNSLRSSWIDLTKTYLDPKREASPKTRERRAHEKMAQKRERKAARTLAIITGSFISCWLPFFIIAIVRPFCGSSCHYPPLLLSVINWLGYFNSLLNPIIYTIFNPDFRTAFQKILFGRYRKPKYQRANTS